MAIANNSFHGGGDDRVPAITVVVDAVCSKRSHQQSYNANSGVGVIFGAATKRLPHIRVRSKYCSICAVSKGKNVPAPEHKCYCNWSGSSCCMEADLI